MKAYTFDDFTINSNNETIVTDIQLWISLFNSSVSDIFKQIAQKELNKYIVTHQKLTFDKSDELICVLQAYMTNYKPLDEKFSILIFVCNEDKGFQKNCAINIPILPNKDYFKDFKQLVIAELDKIIFS